MKVNECQDLKMQNRALIEENARFRGLAEKLLGHAAFRPFLEDLSRDPEMAASLSTVVGGSQSAPSQQIKKDADPYNVNSQQFLSPNQNNQNQHVGMTLIPETQIDFSSLNLGTNNWNMQSTMGMNGAYQSQVFAVLEVPEEPINVAALSGKGEETVEEQETTFETCKYDCPTEIETPEVSKDMPTIEAKETETTESTSSLFDEQDPSFTLYATVSTSAPSILDNAFTLLSQLPAQKPTQFTLTNETDSTFEKQCAKLDASCRRLDAMFASFRF